MTICQLHVNSKEKAVHLRSLTAGWVTVAAWGGGEGIRAELDRGPRALTCATSRLDNLLSQGPPSRKIPSDTKLQLLLSIAQGRHLESHHWRSVQQVQLISLHNVIHLA